MSVVIPVFNSEKSIEISVASIQRQKLKEIEIILVNDFSKDKSKNIIENMQKEDPRIIIINNSKNMGTFYSRNVGSLYAKGKYIFALDNDDMFLNDYIIHKTYNIAVKNNYDILGFNAIYSNNYNSDVSDMFIDPFINDKNDKVLFQPNLKFLSLTNNDIHIWGKCIKSKIYKEAISSLGKKRSTTYLCNSEDDVIVYMLFRIAESFRFIPFFGIFHLISSYSASNTLSNNHKIYSKIFFLDMVFDFTDNTVKEKQFVVDIAIIIKNYSLSKNLPFNKNNTKYLKKVLKKIYNCPFISVENKKHLKKIF